MAKDGDLPVGVVVELKELLLQGFWVQGLTSALGL